MKKADHHEHDSAITQVRTGNEVRWRQPSKFSGRLASELISFCSRFHDIEHVHFAEIAMPEAPNDFHPILAVTFRAGASRKSCEDLIIELCFVVQEHGETGVPVDVCRTDDFPPFAQASAQGLARRLYARAKTA